jgi:trk system potassium uptake protein TrkA
MRVVVAGAGFTGRRLIAKLVANRHDVVSIDLSHEVCEQISSQLGVTAICGNATDISSLEEAEVGKANVAVGLMRQSADNLAFALLSRGAGVERIVARLPNPKYREAYEQAGVTSIIDIAGLFLDQLMLEIERPQVHQVAAVGAGGGAIVAVRVPRNAHVVGKTIDGLYSERRYRGRVLIAGIIRFRDGELVIPSGDDRLQAGDQVLLSGKMDALRDVVDYLGAKSGLASLFRLGKQQESELSEIQRQTQIELDTALEEQDDDASDSESA